MSESLFDIFGDQLTKNSTRSVPRQPLSDNENIGKQISTGPVKPNEPLKKAGESKKSFLSNTGKALRGIQTPIQKVYSPRNRNIETSAKKVLNSKFIFSDDLDDDAKKFYEELEFTKPSYRYDNYHTDVVDYLFAEPEVLDSPSPPTTPPPAVANHSMEFDCSYEDDFFTDNFASDSNPSPFEEDEFPDLFAD